MLLSVGGAPPHGTAGRAHTWAWMDMGVGTWTWAVNSISTSPYPMQSLVLPVPVPVLGISLGWAWPQGLASRELAARPAGSPLEILALHGTWGRT